MYVYKKVNRYRLLRGGQVVFIPKMEQALLLLVQKHGKDWLTQGELISYKSNTVTDILYCLLS